MSSPLQHRQQQRCPDQVQLRRQLLQQQARGQQCNAGCSGHSCNREDWLLAPALQQRYRSSTCIARCCSCRLAVWLRGRHQALRTCIRAWMGRIK